MINPVMSRYDMKTNAGHFQEYIYVGRKTILLNYIRVEVLQMLCTLV